jgi:hypothetical protein
MRLTWDPCAPAYELLRCADLAAGPWNTQRVHYAQSPLRLSVPDPAGYYRLRGLHRDFYIAK